MAHVKLLLNVAVVVQQAKYLDWLPPKEFGSQLRLKGTINGEPDSVMYLPGKCWAVGKALINAGVIGEMSFDEEPTESINISLLKTAFVLTNKQVAGKNYGNISVSFLEPSHKPPEPKTIYEAGPGLPGEEDGYLNALTQQGGGSARNVTQFSVIVNANTMESTGKLYLECMKFVVDRIVPLWEKGDVVIDASALNAATATLMIQRGKR